MMHLYQIIRILPIKTALVFVWMMLLGSVSTIFPQVNAQDLEVTAGQPIADQYIEEAALTHSIIEAKVVRVIEEVVEAYDESQDIVFQTLEMSIIKPTARKGQVLTVEYNRTLSQGQKPMVVGDVVLVNQTSDQGGTSSHYIIDYVRRDAILKLFILFVIVVLLVGMGKGLSSLIGLISSFVIIFGLIIPGIQSGADPLMIALVGATLIITITFYISHGINEKTTWAVIGTIVSLFVSGVLANYFIGAARLTGYGTEEVAFLQLLKAGDLNISGLLLAGILIGALGVLDDITISQASIVKELKKTNPKLSPQELFIKSMTVGRDHIASLVNTLILVYTGSSLPLLLLFTIDESRSIVDVINYEMVAEEIVHTLVASIGLVIAVPITTALVCWFGFKSLSKKS